MSTWMKWVLFGMALCFGLLLLPAVGFTEAIAIPLVLCFFVWVTVGLLLILRGTLRWLFRS